MAHRRLFWLTVLGLGLTAGILVAQAPPERPPGYRPPPRLPEGTQTHRDLQYATADEKANRLDLYVPKSDKPLPLVVWIHGGAWRAGTKDRCPALPMLSQGYAVASVEYRLSRVAIWPAQIHDCKAAVRFLRANAAKYNLNPERFGAWGGSAGGHLVALLATTGGVKELEGDLGNADQSSRLQAVVNWFGPTDFLTMQEQADKNPHSKMEHNSAKSPESQLIGGALMENKDKAAAASPVTYVSKDDCPILTMHGDKDPLVPHQQAQEFHDALKKAGADSTLEIIPGAGHGFGGPDIMKKVQEFFDKHLKKQ